MKTKVDARLKKKMGLKIVNGQLTDKYGRIFETFIDNQGFEDIKPVGVQRDIQGYNLTRG